LKSHGDQVEVPGDWKKGSIMPIFKKGRKNELPIC